MELCKKIDKTFEELRVNADKLTPYAVDTRYPVFYPIVTNKYANEAVTLAQEIINFIRKITKII